MINIYNYVNEKLALNKQSKLVSYKDNSKRILTFFSKLDSYKDFTKYDLYDGLPKLIKKIEQFFTKLDPSYKLEWINRKEFFSSGWFSFTAVLDLTYNGRNIQLKINWRDNYHHTTAYIKADDTTIFDLGKTTTVWDPGLSTNDHHISTSNKIKEIFA